MEIGIVEWYLEGVGAKYVWSLFVQGWQKHSITFWLTATLCLLYIWEVKVLGDGLLQICILKGTQSHFCACARFWFLDRRSRIQRCWNGDIERQKSVCIVLNKLWLCPITSHNQRSVNMVLEKCQFVCNRDLSVLISMPFDGTSSGGKCYGPGWRQLSPDSFQKGLENWERTEK